MLKIAVSKVNAVTILPSYMYYTLLTLPAWPPGSLETNKAVYNYTT